MFLRALVALTAAATVSFGTAAAPTTNFIDFLQSPTVSTNFENAPVVDFAFYAGGFTYITNGIKIEQVNPGNPIALSLAIQGSKSWYPTGGDYGYTSISMVSGEEMLALSLLYAAGWSEPYTLQFEAFRNGVSVLSGTRLGFYLLPLDFGLEGGGFDEVHLRAIRGTTDVGEFGDGGHNALIIDAVKILLDENKVPEPASLALLGIGLAALAATRRRRS